MDPVILFDSYLGNSQTTDGTIAYSYGPSVTGVPLSSGQYFTGWWSVRLDENGSPILIALPNRESFISETSTGILLNWFSRPNSKNLSFSFDNSGVPVFGVFDQTGISTYYLSGSVQSINWAGFSPVLINDVNVNFPVKIPDHVYPTWKTGELFCFYSLNNNYKYRLLSEGFNTEHNIFALTGLKDAQSKSAFYYQDQKNPHRFVIGNVDGVTLKTLISKSYANFASDDFQLNPTGILNEYSETGYLKFGYTNWKKDCELGFTKGRTFSKDIYFVDNFMSYPTGNLNIFIKPFYYLPAKFQGLSTGYRKIII